MKFVIRDKVRVISTGYAGEVKQSEDKTMCKIDIETNKVVTEHTKRYLITYVDSSGRTNRDWYHEKELECADTLADEESVNKVLIDVALTNRNYEMIKSLSMGGK